MLYVYFSLLVLRNKEFGNMENKPNYYFIAVSNKKNLELCIKYGLAGFMNSINGAWAFLDINQGDLITFIYGARAYNLYKVSKKMAIRNSENLAPWDNIKFRETGNTYYFPFRFELELIREFNEPIVRYEFTYIAENLLLRGGYRKTHFQADQTTLQNVSSMGKKATKQPCNIKYSAKLELIENIKLSFEKNLVKIPETYKFVEVFLQSIVKHYLTNKKNLNNFLEQLKLENLNYEVLSEKALPQGHLDLLLKEAIPIGSSKQIVIEVKTNKASLKDLAQLKSYMEEIGEECIGGIIIAKDFQKKVKENRGTIHLIEYSFDVDKKIDHSFESLIKHLILKEI
ncbi:MAG: hypothetical protein PWQ28_293 [Candidatus Woesearchaeota archaeon]|nr:hypothetical protein [Candidatus Woesearchaeota archaeon]